MLITSVPVVRKILDAAAGSAPHFLRKTGTYAPINPLTIQLTVIAVNIIKDSAIACSLFCWTARK